MVIVALFEFFGSAYLVLELEKRREYKLAPFVEQVATHDEHVARRVVGSACKQILLELNTPFWNSLDKILHALAKVYNSMIKLVLCNKRYTA